MHNLLVHPSEHYERSLKRRIFFGVSVAVILLLTILPQQGVRGGFTVFSNIFALLILLIVIGGYIRSKQYIAKTQLAMIPNDEGVQVGGTLHKRDDIEGYFFEMDTDADAVKNIVILTQKGQYIYSLFAGQSLEQIHEFEYRLNKHTTLISDHEYGFVHNLLRKFKI